MPVLQAHGGDELSCKTVRSTAHTALVDREDIDIRNVDGAVGPLVGVPVAEAGVERLSTAREERPDVLQAPAPRDMPALQLASKALVSLKALEPLQHRFDKSLSIADLQAE